jgi:tRNA-specific 2-thiouridylase
VRVLVAMSGGVDSSVAAALAIEQGHSVVGATMKLWGGPADQGCCSVSDVDDARRVAQQLGIDHHVFNFTEDFQHHVVDAYVADHAAGRTPNPCIECNRHLKFDRFLKRARQIGFDAVATGHHARVERGSDGAWSLRRGADPDKDQSYVLHMLSQEQLPALLLPVGEFTKADVRAKASELGLRTAFKADSQDVCFISRRGGRQAFLSGRIPLHEGRLVDEAGGDAGTVPAAELVTVGQRRGIGDAGGRYVLDVEASTRTIRIGPPEALLVDSIPVSEPSWIAGPPSPEEELEAQMSAHGRPVPAHWDPCGEVRTLQPVRKVAPGQSVVLYRGDAVVGGGVALRAG